MKLVVQDGSSISRRQLQAVITRLPEHLSRRVGMLLVCACRESSLRLSYSPKERCLTMFVPAHEAAPLPTTDVVRELLIALAVIAGRGELPARLSRSVQEKAFQTTDAIFAIVTTAVGGTAIDRSVN